MVQCLRTHVSMIEMAILQLTAYRVHGVNLIGRVVLIRWRLAAVLQIPPPTPQTVLDIPLQGQLLVARSSAGHLATLSILSYPILLPC
jgi:hypothetical protein